MRSPVNRNAAEQVGPPDRDLSPVRRNLMFQTMAPGSPERPRTFTPRAPPPDFPPANALDTDDFPDLAPASTAPSPLQSPPPPLTASSTSEARAMDTHHTTLLAASFRDAVADTAPLAEQC